VKILTPEQIRKVDLFTINNEPIPSIDLMERASREVCHWIEQKYPDGSYCIFCGPGNNGGDGLAIARLLHQKQRQVTVYIPALSNKRANDAQTNLDRLKGINPKGVHEIDHIDQIPFDSIHPDTIIIDAIFGSGLNRKTEGLARLVISKINQLPNTVIAIDIPSGLFANYDTISKNREGIIKADYTLTFQLPRLSFLLPENASFVGDWQIIDIQLMQEGIDLQSTNFNLIDDSHIVEVRKKRKKFTNKGNYGHALLIAGSYGKMGAAILAAKACLKSGVGLLTTHIPHFGYQIMQSTVPEAMTSIDRSEIIFTEFPELSVYKAIGIGPGLDTKKNSAKAFEDLLDKISDQKLVIDADGINILSQNKFLLIKLAKNTILTPHPKEFERLVGGWQNEMDRLMILQQFCQHYDVITVLKGAHTVIALPDGKCFFNATGNPGMATAGSGDVLTGIILGLLAQGYNEKDAAILGVYIHGMAGDLALNSESEESLIASDIISRLGTAFNKINTKQIKQQ
jgi:NAD(P)H-hydrate epimerase